MNHSQIIEIECSVLSAMLQSRKAIGLVLGVLEEGDFSDHRHGIIFRAIRGLHEKNQPIDPLTTAKALNQTGQLKRIGGGAYLGNLFSYEPTLSHVKHHAEIIKDQAIARRAAEIGREIVDRARSGESGSELLNWAGRSISDLSSSQCRSEARNAHALVDKALKLMDRRVNLETPPGVETGFMDLDARLLGLQGGDLIILAGRPGSGKSALAWQTCLNVAKRGDPACFLSLEMSDTQLMDRMAAIETGIDLTKIRAGALVEAEIQRVTDKLTELGQIPLYIEEMGAPSVEQISAAAMQLHDRVGLKLLAVDYLQLSQGRGDTANNQVAHVSKHLKGLAKKLNIPVLVLSQLNRGVESRPDKRPQLRDLRDSGAIEQDGDVILFIYRGVMYGDEDKKTGPNTAEIIIGKNRQGCTDVVKLRYIPHLTKFQNIEWRQPHA